MPNLKNCIRYEGKTYCWDSESETLVEIKITDIPLNEVPEDVLIAMLNEANKEKK